MHSFVNQHPLILMEAAVVEPIRRGKVVPLDPLLVHGGLIYTPSGRDELRKLYVDYAQVASAADLPFLMGTPTWRTNRDRVQQAGARPTINRDAVEFLGEIRSELGSPNIRIGGLVGCKNDCYRPQDSLSAGEAERFHAWQVEQLAEAGADFLMAVTLPAVSEAVGIARAMSRTETPYLISFVIGRTGLLLDGTSLSDAIQAIDSQTQRPPVGYLVNCAYPTFLSPARQPPHLFSRLIGMQANASSMDHAELDGAAELQMDDVAEWGEAMLALQRNQGLKILGGCCGTNARHLRCITDHYRGQPAENARAGI